MHLPLSSRLMLFALCQFLALDQDYLRVESKEVHVPAEHTRGLFAALDKVVRYYEREYKKFNLDGIYGLRILEGVFHNIAEEARTRQTRVDEGSLRLLADLQTRASDTANKSLPYLRAKDPEYYHRVKFLVDRPWTNIKRFRNLDLSQQAPVKKDSPYLENAMDRCFAALTRRHGNLSTFACDITDKCWQFVSAKGMTGYWVTHQALYFMIAEMADCYKAINAKLKALHMPERLEDVYEGLCATLYPQLLTQERELTTQDIQAMDLYMEEEVVCGLLGYHKFLSFDRLSQVLDWQLSSGCYGNIPKTGGTGDGGDHDESDGVGEQAVRSRRKRRFALELADGCDTHTTGVATGLLAVYVRWLLSYEQVHYLQHHVMRGSI